MAWIKIGTKSGYVVTYVANGEYIKKRIKKGADCIAAAPTVSRSGYSFRGWREDTQRIAQVLPSRICDSNDIVLYAVWTRTVVHGGNISIGAGYWGYDTNPDGSGYNWSAGGGGDCDHRCGYNCGVTYYNIWPGSGWNEANGDGTYTPHPGWHNSLSTSWTKSNTIVDVG